MSAAEKSALLRQIPAPYLVNEEEVVSNQNSPPKLRSLLPSVAATSKRGVGFKPILESMVTSPDHEGSVHPAVAQII